MTPRYPMPDGGPGYVEYPPGAAGLVAPQIDALPDTGYRRPSPVYATGTVRLPVVVKCGFTGCPTAIAMPPGTPDPVQTIRLETAGWLKGALTGWVCPFPADHSPAAGRARRGVGPAWARASVAIGIYLILLALAVWPVYLFGGGGASALVDMLVVTICWWGFVALRWTARARRPR